jgi:hypothetical protein
MRVLMLFLLLSPTPVMSDHLPQDLLAKGEAEKTLCGIDVNKSHASDLLARFGKPITYEKYPATKDAAEITWNRGGSRIHVYVNIDNVTYGVEISGSPASDATTGRGLSLGQTLADLKRVYGGRFEHNGSKITIQWQDGTELRATLLKGRISRLMLVAPVE